MDLIGKARRRLQGVFFNGRLVFNRVLGLPAQTLKEIKIFRMIFDDQTRAGIKLNVFEWGSGYSTIFYAKYLNKKKVDLNWHSIDNNCVWHNRVKAMVAKEKLTSSVRLYVKEFIPFWAKPEWDAVPPACGQFSPMSENEIAYTRFPLELDMKFNIVIIDARFRRHCLQTTKEILLKNGIVIMHDAQKPHYHLGMDEFPYRKFLPSGSWYPFQNPANKIWVGSFDNQQGIDILNSYT